MYVTEGFDKTVEHHYSGESRPFQLKGRFYCVEMSKDEYSALTDIEIKRFTRSHAKAFTALENGGCKFYFEPRPRWRFLTACRQPISLEQLRLVTELTGQSRSAINGKTANKMLHYLFQECWEELGETKLAPKVPGLVEIRYDSRKLVLTLPRMVLDALIATKSYGRCHNRMRKLADNVQLIPN